MKEFWDFPAGNLPSFIEVTITVSKSKPDFLTPIICKPLSGSPSKETSAINYLFINGV
jgi:hypothetical protein